MDTSEGLKFIANTYARFPIFIEKAEGIKVWDKDGKEYIDFTSGIAVCNLGHCNKEVIRAVSNQMNRLFHISNLYWTHPQIEVARILVENSCADKVFFCNSGAEAVEAAIKLARKYAHETKGPDCYEIISLEGSFHGRTLAAITATGQRIYQRGFEPLPDGFTHVPPNDVKSLELAVNQRVAGILLEPIQGEGGVRPLNDNFLMAARELADKWNIPLIFDEVQVGIGRTGTLFAYEQTPIEPDVICLAKALGNGVPIGAMLSKEKFIKCLGPGSHASTFGGNPLACSAAKTVLTIITDKDFLKSVQEKGKYLSKSLEELRSEFSIVEEVRGRGLIQAIEFKEELPSLLEHLMQNGFLAIFTHGKILRLLPPLIVEKEHIDSFLSCIRNFLQEN